MKYLKLFENDGESLDSKYDEDNYILLLEDYHISFESDEKERRGIIMSLVYHKDDGWAYDIMLVNSSVEFGVPEYGIERTLTDKEIEQIKIEEEANKYNL